MRRRFPWLEPLAATLLSLCILLAAGRPLLEAALPAQRAVLALLAPDFRLLRLELKGHMRWPTLQATVMLARPVQLGERRLEPHPQGVAFADVRLGQLLQAPALVVLLLSVWPGGGIRRRARRLALALPPLLLLGLLDAPLVLAGLLWELLFDLHLPGQAHGLSHAKAFLQGGGRLLLGGAVALLVLAWTDGIMTSRNAMDDD
jgi:hypothetical protein